MKALTGAEIAVIGMDGRFPDADNINDFWNNLESGLESVKTLQEEDVLAEGEDPVSLDNPAYVKANAFMQGKQYFDADFFGFLPDEAALMDPQMRIFLELCWGALEDAGHNLDQPGKIGMFAGGNPNVNWETYALLKNKEGLVDTYGLEHLINVSYMCSRAANILNLQGPAVHIDTACSTSLVAVQRACMSLLLRECNMALAGGVTISNFTHKGYMYQEGMINSKDGHCRTFDADASGTIRGEGGGVVVLKRLKDALKDKDNIRAVIRGSGVNNDGSSKISFTAPSVDGQHKAILKAINMAGIQPGTISYVEAHGTGTNLGDPIEIEALNMAFGNTETKKCAIGSVKSNIGHLSAAAGVAGLIKTILALQNKKIPASLHFQKPNPKINFDNGPFYVNTELQTWQNGQYPRRAGVSSFGIGGTNAHLVLEEAPVSESDDSSRDVQLLTFSAKSEAALNRNIVNLREHLAKHNELKLADAAFTMNVGRTPLKYRKCIVGRDQEEILAKLDGLIEKETIGSPEPAPEVVFMFSGQGAQYVNMGKGLYQSEPVFKEQVDACAALYKEITGRPLTEILFAEEKSDNLINETKYTQPALFAIEYAMTRLLMTWGVQPDLMIGHSLGEYVAACVSGLWSLRDAMSIVIKRAELMQAAPKGSMLSISASLELLQRVLNGREDLSIAAVNSSELCVVSGATESVTTFQKELEKEGFKSRILKTSHAFHSHLMDKVLNDFTRVFDSVKFQSLEIPLVSNVTGKVLGTKEASTADYWVKHLRHAVQFEQGMETLLAGKNRLFIELGPGKALGTFVRAHKNRQRQHRVAHMIPGPKDSTNDRSYLHEGLGKIWQSGIIPDWSAYYQNELRKKVALPTYSFEKVEYPVVVDARREIRELTVQGTDQKDPKTENWFYVPSWRLERQPITENKPNANRDTILYLGEDNEPENVIRNTVDSTRFVSVSAGKSFKKKSSGQYAINPAKPADFDLLFDQLKVDNLLPDRIIHAWGIESDKATGDADERARSFFSIVSLLQSYQKVGIKDLHLAVVASGVQGVLESAPLPASGSLVPGLLKVSAQEFPTLHTSHIDINPADFEESSFAAALTAEIAEEAPGKVVALRGGRRFVESFHPIKASAKIGKGFRQGATYLITGGLGPLGFHLSKYLLREYNASLILLGRTAMPIEVEDDSVVELKESEIRKKTDRLRYLSGIGKVMYKACDVSDYSLLKKSIKEAEAELGAISGIFHAAGINEGHSIEGSITGLRIGDFEEQLAPKLSGVVNLDRYFKDRDIDFCLLTSSLSSILGGLGFGAYAPANTFLDFFARYQADKNPGRWISANLDGFHFKGRSAEAIDEHEIIPVFEQLVALKGQAQVVVSIKALEDRLNKWVLMDTAGHTEEQDIQAASARRGATAAETEESIIEEVLELWRSFFGKTDITVKDDFFEIGGDSLKVLTMIARLHKVFDVEIPVKAFFEAPVAGKIAASVFNQRKERQTGTAYSAIPEVAIRDRYELSSAQKRLYFLYEFDPKSIAYNIPFFATIKGVLNEEKLLDTFQKLIARHESLRTKFTKLDGIVSQQIEEKADLSLEQVGPVTSIKSTVRKFVRPFDLSKTPLLRVGIGELKPNEHLLMIDVHHIISDDVSLNILLSDFMAIYAEQSLPKPELTYKDYASWQQQQKDHTDLRTFWLEQYSTIPDPLELPTDFQRPPRLSNEGAAVHFGLDADQTTALKELGDKHGTTLFMTLLSIYYVLLGKLSGQEDIVVGTPITGRNHADLGEIMGMFVNTLPIRNRPESSQSFLDFMQQVKETALACFENQAYQFEDLIEQLKLERNVSRNALFDAMFVFHNTDKADVSIPGLEIAPLERVHTVAKFDLKLEGAEEKGGIKLNFDYGTRLFKTSTVERFADYFKVIVDEVIKDVNTKIIDLNLLQEPAYQKLVRGFNGTNVELSPMDSVIGRFAEQVLLTPDRFAVADESISLTYTELNARADDLATQLSAVSDKSTFAGIYLKSTINMAVAILAVLKAGKGFLPLDPNQPAGRIKGILDDSDCQVLITESALSQSLAFIGSIIDIHEIEKAEAPASRWAEVKAADLAYIIYTSGSTGKPKGVTVSHENLWNYFNWFVETVNITEQDRLLVNSSFAVDAVYTQVFGALLSGAALHILPRETYLEPAKLISYIGENEISFLKMTPTLFNLILNSKSFNETALQKVRTIMLGGESVRPTDVREAMELYPKIRFMNHYGPTETTIGSIAQYISIEALDDFIANPTIGKPIFNTQCYLLNEQGRLVTPGSTGELCIAGAGVAMGYLNGIKGSFVENPFEAGTRMYKTGDLCRYKEDGRLEFLGRNDFQVKVRGYRIDPSEIEFQLNKFPGISNGVVVSRERDGDQYLVAYFQGIPGIAAADIKAFLALQLPDYMVPGFYVRLEQIPLTNSGKVDRSKLPEPEMESAEEYQAPESEVEKQLVEIWAKLLMLETDQISTRTSFFELGGNSMKVIQLVSRIQSAMNVSLSVVDLYEYSTIEKLTEFLNSNQQETRADQEKQESEPEDNTYDQLTDAIAKFGE